MSSIKSAIEHAIQYLQNDLHLNESARPEAQEIVRKLQAADLPAESNDKYTDLKDYIGGKISEMFDCNECALTDHQANHLNDIEQHIQTLGCPVKEDSKNLKELSSKTYRGLKEALKSIPEDHLDDNLSLYVKKDDEYYPVAFDVTFPDSQGILDGNHPVLELSYL